VPIRLILAEDNYLVRQGVKQLLESQPDLELVSVCENYDSLLAAVDAHQPDVILTDIRMPPPGPTRASGPPSAYVRATRKPESSC
jgi:DNA-binding NarL/FixJ family response regulator